MNLELIMCEKNMIQYRHNSSIKCAKNKLQVEFLFTQTYNIRMCFLITC